MCARHKGFFYRFRVPIRILVVVSLIAGAGYAGYFLSQLGPRSVSREQLAAMRLDEGQIQEMMAGAIQLREQFDKITALRKPTAADIALLGEAEQQLVDALQAAGGAHQTIRETLESIREEYHTQNAALLIEQSREYEYEAERVPDEDVARKTELLDKAIALQEQIHEDYPLGDQRDMVRLRRMSHTRDNLKAKPIYDRSIAAQQRAEAAMEAKDWEAAEAAYTEAIEVQKTLNMKYRDLRYADVNRLSRLEVDLITLKSAELNEQVEALKTEGATLLEKGAFREAASAYRRAERAQEQLNRQYPESRYAQSQKLEALQVLRQNALGSELAAEILMEMTALDAALLERRVWVAIDHIENLRLKMRQFTDTYPRNTAISKEDRLKIEFLQYIQDDIALLQERIYDQLLPVPGGDQWHLMKAEVSQALYSSIMLANPSRSKGELYPVDSITWDDAVEFCQKVSWLLGRPVRLPLKVEFQNAIGPLRYVDLNAVSWNQQNSGGVTHHVATKEPNEFGYHDLLGNVAEWLQSVEMADTAEGQLAGGNAETSIDKLVDKPITISSKRTRNRLHGFRIAVSM